MRAWLGRGMAAGRLVAERADLWLPGALAWLAFLGWLPFLLAVVRLPNAGDLAFFASSLYSASSWPLDGLLLGAAAVVTALAAALLTAIGEAALLRAIDAGDPRTRLSVDAARVFAVELVAAVPAILVLSGLVIALAAVAPGEYQAPDIGGPFVLRVALRVAPLLVGLVVAILIGQALGGAAIRHLAPRRDEPFGAAVRSAVGASLRQIVRRPRRVLAAAIGTVAVSIVYLAAVYLLLGVLWRPISASFVAGQAGGTGTPLLLVGFMAIWMCLVAGGGALHAWVTTWWSMEVEQQL